MEIRPIKQEYVFSVANHTMRAVALHENDERNLSYYFDDKLVARKKMPGGEYYTDDECISEVVDDYRKNNTGVYADLLNRHVDKIRLTAKYLEVDISYMGLTGKAKAKIVKDYYEVEISTYDGGDLICGKIKANSFSEVLEKMRLFVTVLGGVSSELSEKITLLSSDKIEEVISWE